MNWQLLAPRQYPPAPHLNHRSPSRGRGRVLSPGDLSCELRMPLSNVNYHRYRLRRTGLVELIGERPVRGATEHFYREKRTTGLEPATVLSAT